MSRRIGVLASRLDERDAVSRDALGMQTLFQRLGFETECFTPDGESTISSLPVREIGNFLKGVEDALVVHISSDLERLLPALKSGSYRKYIKYHNITPAHFFDESNPAYAASLRKARDSLPLLSDLSLDGVLADSRYNLQEILPFCSTTNHAVLPPFHQVDELLKQDPDINLLTRYVSGPRNWCNWISVGRVAPNKNHLQLIESFKIFKQKCEARSRLFIAGSADPALPSLQRDLGRAIEESGVSQSITLFGSVTASRLKSLYLASSIYVTTSLHEGFCVPVVESMALGVPAVSNSAGALSETGSGFALMPEENDIVDPEWYAAAAELVWTQPEIRETLVEQGFRRYRESFSTEAVESSWVSFLHKSGFLSEDMQEF